MRTGKNRTFVIDEEHLNKVEAQRDRGKGLVGGDVTRIPGHRLGLRPHTELEEIPEVSRFFQGSAGDEQAQYLAHRPLEVEIGFGGGQFLFQRASHHPERHFVGFEIRRSFCLSLVERIHKAGLQNLRICYEDVRQALPDLVPADSIARCSVFFPDPWWKRKHIKRRLLTPSFLDLMCEKLVPQGILHVKTDVLPYGEQIRELFAQDGRFVLGDESLDEQFADDLPTEREHYCINRDLPFVDLRYILKG